MIIGLVVGFMIDTEFDHGARWPQCTVTYSIDHTSRQFNRAVRDIDQISGIDFVRREDGSAAVTIRHHQENASEVLYGPIMTLFVAGTAAPEEDETNRYVAGQVDIWAPYDDMSAGSRRNVWRHELSHILGLGHSDRRRDVMYPSVRSSTKVTPEWRAKLRSLYPECK